MRACKNKRTRGRKHHLEDASYAAPSSVHSRFLFKSYIWAFWVHKGNKVWLQTARRFCTRSLERSSSPFKCHATNRQDSHPSRKNGSSTIKISSAAHDGEMCGNTHFKVARNLNTVETPYTTPRPKWDGTRSPEKHARPRDSTCEVIANTSLSIATQARGGNHTGRPSSQTTASHKTGLGSRDAATRNPMGLQGSKATRQPDITGTTGQGSRNQTL